MEISELRARYLDFFRTRGHAVVPSASLVPANDPTTLFTGSGMQPLVPYLLGKDHPAGTRITNSQKCFRAMDIEEVGDNRHTTFFEMLGNWSLGDYFKKEQLPWFFELLTEEVGLDPKRLFVTVFDGAEEIGVPRDEEAIRIWQELFKGKGIEAPFVSVGTEERGYELGMREGRIFGYTEKNWWSRAGAPEKMPVGEPGGPDSEVFYDFGTPHDPRFGAHCHPNCDCGRFLEIGNSVFMQFLKNDDGSFGELPKRNVDFGGGLERIVMAKTNSPDIVAVCHRPVLDHLEKASGKRYGEHEEETRAFRIIADHMKATVFLIGDGVRPSNTDQGYFVRRLIRRSVRYADSLGISESTLASVVRPVAEMYADAYPELSENAAHIEELVSEEEAKFRKTLARGLKELEKGTDAFTLFTTYGFPLELTKEIAKEKGIAVDEAAFRKAMEEHQSLSRAGSEQKFKGGLADASEATTRLHTAHHLLLKALQMVLGPDVKQRGSNITGERLRIDFAHGAKMTDEQKREVERIVNEKIAAELPVIRSTLPREEAEKLGAEMEFGAKYPEMVSVYSVGPKEANESNPRFSESFSIEFCGGPHVANTREIGKSGTFKIQKEEAVAAGIRRIKAVLS